MMLKMLDTNIDINGIKLFLDEDFNEKNLVNISKFIVAPFHETPWDQHEVNELWFVLKGAGIVYKEDNLTSLISEGNVFFIDSNIRHKVKNIGKSDLLIFSIWWNNNGI